MSLEILVRYIHFICVFLIVASLSGEFLLLKKELTRKEIKRLFQLDNLYGISTIVLLGAGFTLWLAIGKPAEFYSKNWIFHLKIGLFALMGILSIYPTLFFRQQRKGNDPEEMVTIPHLVLRLVRLELIILVFIPLTASLMARGVGYFG
ncbi:MAG: DUF2214 family protein [Bacteroidota bacterium]